MDKDTRQEKKKREGTKGPSIFGTLTLNDQYRDTAH